MTELYQPALLDPDKHQRGDFSCGEDSLDDWLQRYAGQNRRNNTAATWVIADDQFRVVAYATLSMTSVDMSAAPAAMTKAAPRQIPALLVGRLAVDCGFSGLGLGTAMVKHVLDTALDLNERAACKAIVVTASNEGARGWWQRFGFARFSEDPGDFDLYLLTKDIERTLASLL